MPRAWTTSQRPGVPAAGGRVAGAAVLALLLTGLVVPASAREAGAVPVDSAGARVAPAAAIPAARSGEPTTAQPGTAEATTPAGPPQPTRLDGAVTARRYGLPTALAVVLLLGVASLQVRLLLAEPAARPAEPAAAPRPAPRRRHGVGSPRW